MYVPDFASCFRSHVVGELAMNYFDLPFLMHSEFFIRLINVEIEESQVCTFLGPELGLFLLLFYCTFLCLFLVCAFLLN
jgi:hypothetical protein